MNTVSNVKKGIFIGETISDKLLKEEDLSGCRLMDSTIRSLRFLEGRCRYLRAQNTRLQKSFFDHVLCDKGLYRECRWENVQARNSFFTENHFSMCTLEKTDVKLSTFGLSTFHDCRLTESSLSEISFSGTWWYKCRFENENYFFVRFPSSVFIDTKFVGCHLQKVIFRAAIFIRCTFEKCTLDDSVFHKARIIDTEWIDTDINQAANLKEIRYD